MKLDEQGRLLPQVHQRALAAAGFELVRSAEVIVAFQRHLLGASSSLTEAEAAALPVLNGTIIETGGVVAFDGEWQYPAITEQLACRLAMQRLPSASDMVYVGFPWASLIDHLRNDTLRGRALQQQLQQLVPRLEGRRRRITVCQQIFFQEHRWAFELAGITDVFWPHATIHSSLPWITLHPFPLFAVQWQAQSEAEKERDILYSFIGAQATRLYLSNSRDLILSNLANLPGSLIHGNANWFYQDLIYGVQIRGTIQPDDPRAQGSGPQEQRQRYIDSLQRSIFALCPSGTGPNTIRLWEALGYGAIPVVLSDTWKPPGPRELWDAAVFFLPDTPEGVMSIPRLTAQWAADEMLLLKKRQAMAELWHRYGPDNFITDIEALWQQGCSPMEGRSARTQLPSPQAATPVATAAQVATRTGPPVTLTAISGRLDRLPAVLDSLRAQTLRPAQVHLHLSCEPHLLDQGVDPNHPVVVGLGDDPMVQIHWVANLGPYRKIVPFLEAGGYNNRGGVYSSKQEDLFITVDDDTLYPPRFIEYLLRHHERHGCIVAHRGWRMRTAAVGGFVPYKGWHDGLREPRLANLATGQSGVLYRRSYFPDDLKLNAALTLAPTHDDLWLRWLTAREGQPAVILQSNAAAKANELAFPNASPVSAEEQPSLWLAYNAPEAAEGGSGGHDAACKAIHTYFRTRGFDLEALLRQEQEEKADFY
ncbi:MAG: exostosin family protein [Cyanobium sp.]